MNIWRKIWDSFYFFVAIVCFGYVVETLLFKFGFNEMAPKIYDNLFTNILISIIGGFFFKNKETKKSDIYFFVGIIILTIGFYFYF